MLLVSSEISEEEGEDAYCYTGEACLTGIGRGLRSKSVSSSSGSSPDESEGNSERATGDTFKWCIDQLVWKFLNTFLRNNDFHSDTFVVGI